MAERRPSAPEAESEEALEQASPAAVAIALSRSGKGSKSLDADAQTFLREQTKFLKLQTEHLHEQRELQLAHLRVRRWRDRLSIALQGLAVAAGVAVACTLAFAVWDASRSHALVIEPLATPPDLAQQGLTGPVAARELQDELAAMDRDTDSARAPLSYAHNWVDDIKVEIPETGLSIPDLERILRDKLGHDTHVTGEIVRTGDQLTISVRTADADAVSVTGPVNDVRGLLRKAAEQVYLRTQPYRYSILIQERDHDYAGARAINLKLVASGDFEDRVWALANLGQNADTLRQGHDYTLQAIRADPNMAMFNFDLITLDDNLGRWEEMVSTGRKARELLPRAEGVRIRPEAARWIRTFAVVFPADALGDYQGEIAALDAMQGQPDYSGGLKWLPVRKGRVLTLMHEPTRARPLLASFGDPASEITAMVINGDFSVTSASSALDDWSGVAQDLEPYVGGALTAQNRDYLAPSVAPLLGEAYAHLGRNAEADRLLATVDADNYGGLRALGRVAAFRGDAAGADRWFAAAIKQGPSLPEAETNWGAALIARGQYDAAIAKLKSAHDKGPHYADPLEVWGEALAAKRDFEGAIGKFREADRFAPRWGRTHLRWGEALLRLGKTRDARAQFAIARGLDLSAADRDELVRVAGPA